MNLPSEISIIIIQRTPLAAMPVATGVTDTPLAAVIAMSVSEEATQPFAIFAPFEAIVFPGVGVLAAGAQQFFRASACLRRGRNSFSERRHACGGGATTFPGVGVLAAEAQQFFRASACLRRRMQLLYKVS